MCGWKAGLIILLFGIFLLVLFCVYTKRRYRDLEALNEYLAKVLADHEVPELSDQEEGELSILKANIYKVTTKLKYQKELLQKDKTELADAMADISHQMKTPLTSMMIMNDLLKEEADEEKRKEFLNTQAAQLNRMNWLRTQPCNKKPGGGFHEPCIKDGKCFCSICGET